MNTYICVHVSCKVVNKNIQTHNQPNKQTNERTTFSKPQEQWLIEWKRYTRCSSSTVANFYSFSPLPLNCRYSDDAHHFSLVCVSLSQRLQIVFCLFCFNFCSHFICFFHRQMLLPNVWDEIKHFFKICGHKKTKHLKNVCWLFHAAVCMCVCYAHRHHQYQYLFHTQRVLMLSRERWMNRE